MNRMLIVLVLVVAGVLGLGLYRKWLDVGLDSARSNITFPVDKDPIQEDKQESQEKMHDLGQQVTDKAAAPTEKRKDDPAAPPVEPPQNRE